MSRTRLPDWRTRLHRWAREHVGQEFVWGRTDCASLGQSALHAMFGEPVLPAVPQWVTAAGALRTLQAVGPIGALLVQAGAQVRPLPFIRAGDIVLQMEEDEPVGQTSILVCVDQQQCVGSARKGVMWCTPASGLVYSLWEVTAHGR